MLSDDEISDLCSQHLGPLTAIIEKRLGREAADHTGICLFEALRAYDQAKNPDLMAWLRYKVKNLVLEKIRSFDGRKGTARHAAMSAKTSVEDFDSPIPDTPDQRSGGREELQQALKAIEDSGKLARLILIGRFFGSFSNKEIGLLTNVDRTQIHREATRLQQLLPSDRLPHAVRRKHRRVALR